MSLSVEFRVNGHPIALIVAHDNVRRRMLASPADIQRDYWRHRYCVAFLNVCSGSLTIREKRWRARSAGASTSTSPARRRCCRRS